MLGLHFEKERNNAPIYNTWPVAKNNMVAKIVGFTPLRTCSPVDSNMCTNLVPIISCTCPCYPRGSTTSSVHDDNIFVYAVVAQLSYDDPALINQAWYEAACLETIDQVRSL